MRLTHAQRVTLHNLRCGAVPDGTGPLQRVQDFVDFRDGTLHACHFYLGDEKTRRLYRIHADGRAERV